MVGVVAVFFFFFFFERESENTVATTCILPKVFRPGSFIEP